MRDTCWTSTNIQVSLTRSIRRGLPTTWQWTPIWPWISSQCLLRSTRNLRVWWTQPRVMTTKKFRWYSKTRRRFNYWVNTSTGFSALNPSLRMFCLPTWTSSTVAFFMFSSALKSSSSSSASSATTFWLNTLLRRLKVVSSLTLNFRET